MIAKRNSFLWTPLVFSLLLLAPLPAVSQDHGGGSGSGGGCGDVFGDLIHILRDDITGQPILAQRWVELPAAVEGYGWGYCPIAVYRVDGVQYEIPFLPYSCDVDPGYADLVEEVDYFGRLNGGRTKERNNRMHFNEVISNIKQADWVTTDEMGRLKMGFGGCKRIAGEMACYEWASVDSPMESMGLYSRIMKYGHIATDPYEIDDWSHGDPKRPTQFNPSLTPKDWAKFDDKLVNLKPAGDISDCWDYDQAEVITDPNNTDDVWTPYEPFFDMNENCVRDGNEPFTDLDFDGNWYPGEAFIDTNGNCVRDDFVFTCAAPEPLDNADFVSGATVLAAAASKTGFGTVDLVAYVNRILRITKNTEHTVSTVSTLPALYRDCWDSIVDPTDPPEEGEVVEPPYLPVGDCAIVDAYPLLPPNYELFPDVQERFVDFSALTEYVRAEEVAEVLYQKKADKKFETLSDDQLISWVENVNSLLLSDSDRENIAGFVNAFNDIVRTIEYVHNYAVPENLFLKYELEDPR